MSPLEWRELRAKGVREPGPAVAARSQVDHPDNPLWTDAQREAWQKQHTEMVERANMGPLGPWERYTRDFVKRFQLDAEQSQRAILILNDCLREGDAYLVRASDKFRAANIAASEAALRADPSASLAAQTQLVELRSPLDQIFEHKEPSEKPYATRVIRLKYTAAGACAAGFSEAPQAETSTSIYSNTGAECRRHLTGGF